MMMKVSLFAAPLVTPRAPPRVVAANANKGFGSGAKSSKGKKEKGSKRAARQRKAKGKTGFRPTAKTSSATSAAAQAAEPAASQSGAPAQGSATQLASQGPPSVLPPEPEAEPVTSVADELAFENRLAELKENSKLLAKEKRLNQQSDAPFAPPKPAKGSTPSAAPSDPYANPPSIMDTMTQASKDDDKVDVFGSSKPAALVASILLAAALLFGTIYTGGGGDDATPRQQVELSKEQKAELESQASAFAKALEENPKDTEALEGAAVTAANLGQYEKAEGLLSQLVAIKTSDPDAWRLLAETRTAIGSTGAAADAYREAFKIASDDVALLKGLAGALLADGKPQQAVDEIQAVGARVREQSTASKKSPAATREPPPASSDGSGAAGEAAGKAEALLAAQEEVQRLSTVEVDLLLAKVYAQWKGHVGDALAVYDRVIAANPEDFRGFLAKGVLLRNEGRKSDADRAFLQARFLAPKELRSIVDRVAAPEQ